MGRQMGWTTHLGIRSGRNDNTEINFSNWCGAVSCEKCDVKWQTYEEIIYSKYFTEIPLKAINFCWKNPCEICKLKWINVPSFTTLPYIVIYYIFTIKVSSSFGNSQAYLGTKITRRNDKWKRTSLRWKYDLIFYGWSVIYKNTRSHTSGRYYKYVEKFILSKSVTGTCWSMCTNLHSNIFIFWYFFICKHFVDRLFWLQVLCIS